MNDEAAAHFFAIINHYQEGHQWLAEKIPGWAPKSSWACDPFGHSSTMPYVLKQSGFGAMVIQRTHYAIKRHLARSRNLEFSWRQLYDDKGVTDFLCHMMPFYSYDIPHTCGPEPAICCTFDFARMSGGPYSCPWGRPAQEITSANVAERANTILDQWRKKSKLYRSNVVLVPLGDDFRYSSMAEANNQFENFERIFAYLNSHPELNVQAQFGTMSDYFAAVYQDVQRSLQAGGAAAASLVPITGLPSLSGDFFTYADKDEEYWSGYYTTRSFHKGFDRLLEMYLRAAEVLFVVTGRLMGSNAASSMHDTGFQRLRAARQELGVFQHHDGITGTAKPHVVLDYAGRLGRSISSMQRLMAERIAATLSFQTVYHLAETDGNAQVTKRRVIALRQAVEARTVIFFNSLPIRRTLIVSVLVDTAAVTVTTLDLTPLEAQVQPVFKTDSSLGVQAGSFELFFEITVGPLGMGSYLLRPSVGVVSAAQLATTTYITPGRRDLDADAATVVGSFGFKIDVTPQGQSSLAEISLDNQFLTVNLDVSSGLITSLMSKGVNAGRSRARSVKESLITIGDRGGAYLFLPTHDGSDNPRTDLMWVRVTKGPLVEEVAVYRGARVTYKLARVYRTAGAQGFAVHNQYTVDLTKFSEAVNIVARFQTDVGNNVDSKPVAWMDSNGFNLMKRQYLPHIARQGNFYPATQLAFIEDGERRFTVHLKQAVAAAALTQGSLEFVMDRRVRCYVRMSARC